MVAQAQSVPGNPVVRHGSASFGQQGNTLLISNSPNSIIDWTAFNIAAGQTTHFSQVNAASRVLNRVSGSMRSEILGALTSNGQVILINPNGITVGPQGRIDTQGFVASSLALSDADFLSGKLRFGNAGQASSGDIVNGGVIQGNGGLVALIGAQVSNSGSIESASGQVALAAGRQVELLDAHSPHIRVALNVGDGRDASGQVHRILQSGRISAAALPATAGDAAGLRLDGGRIVLHAQDN